MALPALEAGEETPSLPAGAGEKAEELVGVVPEKREDVEEQ